MNWNNLSTLSFYYLNKNSTSNEKSLKKETFASHYRRVWTVFSNPLSLPFPSLMSCTPSLEIWDLKMYKIFMNKKGDEIWIIFSLQWLLATLQSQNPNFSGSISNFSIHFERGEGPSLIQGGGSELHCCIQIGKLHIKFPHFFVIFVTLQICKNLSTFFPLILFEQKLIMVD